MPTEPATATPITPIAAEWFAQGLEAAADMLTDRAAHESFAASHPMRQAADDMRARATAARSQS